MCTDDEMIINKCRKYLHKTKNDIGNPYLTNLKNSKGKATIDYSWRSMIIIYSNTMINVRQRCVTADGIEPMIALIMRASLSMTTSLVLMMIMEGTR
jgi:hypothetical protein